MVDGQLLRLPIPELNEERRQEIAKVAHKYAEQARIAVRNVRRDGMEHLKRAEKDHEMGKDEHHSLSTKVQELDRQDHQGNRRGPCQQGSRDHAGLIGQRPHEHALAPNPEQPNVTLAVDKLAWHATDRPAVRHVAIIMDGNGRWAAERGLPRAEGHRQGVESVRRTVEAALELGITHLTLFSFSSENWARPKQEINDLFGLLRRFIRRDLADLHKNGVKIRVIGTRSGLDADLLRLIDDAVELTKDNTALNLTIAFNYGARDEIARAARQHRRGRGERRARRLPT